MEARKHLDIGELMEVLNSQKTQLSVYDPQKDMGQQGSLLCHRTDEMAGWSIKPAKDVPVEWGMTWDLSDLLKAACVTLLLCWFLVYIRDVNTSFLKGIFHS